MEQVTAIIPAAGLGTRMNMPIDKSKELTLYQGRPIIEYTLELCSIYKLTPHVITRKEKTDLIAYCTKRGISCQIIEPKGEWMATVLESRPYWTEENILLLPDTIWSPASAIEQVKFGLEMGNDLVFGLHHVEDGSKWGVIENDDHYLVEKPTETTPGWAWGVIGFRKVLGAHLFKSIRTRGICWIPRASYIKLTSFKDVTRGEE